MTRRKYKKDIDALKPDLKAYNAQREEAMAGSSSSQAALLTGDPSAAEEDMALVKAANSEILYRDANSFVYADHKPSEDAIDRVVHKINMDLHKRNKFSRKRNEEGQDVTYINDANKVSFCLGFPRGMSLPQADHLPPNRTSTRSWTGLFYTCGFLFESG